jgi:shikimate dehydrogenase
MHNAAFQHFRINSTYKIFDLEENELEGFIRARLITGRVSGINVTVPYKIRIKEILERDPRNSLDDICRYIGAVNTIRGEKGKLSAWNTDTWGFYHSLKEDAGFTLSNSDILVLGAGGAGRAISLFLLLMKNTKINSIYIYDIDKRRIDSIIDGYNGWREHKKAKLHGISSIERLYDILPGMDLIINATPLGTKKEDPLPLDLKKAKKGSTVYDLVYARQTEFVRMAKNRGLKASNGEGMLANQGAKAFSYWNENIIKEKDPDLTITTGIMREILRQNLGRE